MHERRCDFLAIHSLIFQNSISQRSLACSLYNLNSEAKCINNQLDVTWLQRAGGSIKTNCEAVQ